MRLVAARDGPHFSHARMHLSGLLDLAFSDSVRPYFYFAWGCFRNFGSRSAMYRARDTRLSMLGAAAKRFSTSSHHALEPDLVRPLFYLRRGARSTPSAARAAIWNAASMPRISVPLSGASNRIASPAWFEAAVTPARQPQASAAASTSAISAQRSGAAIMRTEPAAAIPPSAPQLAESSSPRTLPRSETNSVPSGAM